MADTPAFNEVNAMPPQSMVDCVARASGWWPVNDHAEHSFWNWMASWSRMAASPADMSFDGSRYVLPPMKVVRYRAYGDAKPMAGSLFTLETSATAIHDVKRQTAGARADAVAAIVNGNHEPWIVWCDTDGEADALNQRIPDAVEVRGSHPIEKKEERLAAFAAGEARVLVSKPSICGFGLNFQHCARMAFVGRTFSYEAWYQAVRRCWRFGQTRTVEAHIVVAEGEDQIGRVIDRKAADHDRMKCDMATAMRRAVDTDALTKVPYMPTHEGRLPLWL